MAGCLLAVELGEDEDVLALARDPLWVEETSTWGVSRRKGEAQLQVGFAVTASQPTTNNHGTEPSDWLMKI